MQDGFLKNFNIKPARTLLRMQSARYLGENEMISFEWYSKRIVVTNDMNAIDTTKLIDVMIVSKGISSIRNFSSHFIKQVVLDGSIPQWKAKQLKEQLNSSHIPYHDVTVNGAFILNLE
jgi:competence protein ComEC